MQDNFKQVYLLQADGRKSDSTYRPTGSSQTRLLSDIRTPNFTQARKKCKQFTFIHGLRGTEDSGLEVPDAVSLGKWFPALRTNLVRSSSRVKMSQKNAFA